MTEIKVSSADLSARQFDLNAANLGMPQAAKLKCGSSRGEGFNAFKDHVGRIERLVNQYSELLAKDISALGNVSTNLAEADRHAASALEGGK